MVVFYLIVSHNKPFWHSQSIMGMDDKHWPCLSHKPMAHHGSSWILSSFSRKLDGVQQWKLHSKCVNNQAPKLNFCYNIERAVLEKSVFFPPHWLDDGLGARRQQYTHRPVHRVASSLRAPSPSSSQWGGKKHRFLQNRPVNVVTKMKFWCLIVDTFAM